MHTGRDYPKFGVLFDTATMEVLQMAPVFDNNKSLLPELDNDQLAAPDWYIARCRPRIGRGFILTARGLLTDEIRADLERMRDFTFRQHPKIQAEQMRLQFTMVLGTTGTCLWSPFLRYDGRNSTNDEAK